MTADRMVRTPACIYVDQAINRSMEDDAVLSFLKLLVSC